MSEHTAATATLPTTDAADLLLRALVVFGFAPQGRSRDIAGAVVSFMASQPSEHTTIAVANLVTVIGRVTLDKSA